MMASPTPTTAGTGAATNATEQLTSTQLHSLYASTNGQLTVGSNTVFACLPQTGSGTVKFFAGAIGFVTSGSGSQLSTLQAAATANGCYGTEENGGDDFVNKVKAHLGGAAPAANTIYVEPFSVGSWVSQANGVAQDRSSLARSSKVDLADVDATPLSAGSVNNEPYTGTDAGQNEVADTSFDSSSTWGRNLYVVVPWFELNDPTFLGGSAPEQAIFGTGAGTGAICGTTAQSELNEFGFLKQSQVSGTVPACGAASVIPAVPGHG